jgi:catechol 2,3-dioxygenase-like lactoylglutathione lyase family enzyme
VLIHEDERGVLAIGQQSHAWLSGQLARAWGNEQFGPVDPREEVCLAAEQHDVGWGGWDHMPLLNPQEGRPRSFMEMPLDEHLELFTDGPRRMLSQSRYAALLVSLHGWRLYERRDLDRLPAADAEAIRRFLRDQEGFQAELREALRNDPASASLADEVAVERNSMLIWTWDYLSLALCLDWAPVTAKNCPTAGGDVDLQLTAGREECLSLDPWPFEAPSVSVHCEGRRLEHRFADEQSMRDALERAPWETLRFELRPSGP